MPKIVPLHRHHYYYAGFDTRYREEFNIGADPVRLARMAKQFKKAQVETIENKVYDSVMK